MTKFDEEIARALARRIERDLFDVFSGSTSTVESTASAPLSIDALKNAVSQVKHLAGAYPPAISFTDSALAETTERLFPESKNRSKRIRKKLIKRHGGEFRRQPAMFQIGNDFYVHPALRSQLEARIKETDDVPLYSGYQDTLLRKTWL